MPHIVAMYDKSHAHIRTRLEALGLDLTIATFDKSGRFRLEGRDVAPADMDVDYMWLQSAIGADGFQEGAFALAQACRSVKVLQTFNAGLDHPFYKRMAQKGTRLCNSTAQGVAIAEYVMAQVLALFHPIVEQRAMQAAKQWKITPFREISQTRWVVVGFGAIGSAIGARVRAFGAPVTAIRRNPAPCAHADAVAMPADLPRCLPEADVVVLACPLNASTAGLVDAAFLAAMKPGAILVNIARGGLVDEAALIAALDRDHLSAAILDVFRTEPLPTESALWAHPKIRITSHTSFAGSGGRARWDALFFDNIARFVHGKPLANEVDPRDLT